MAAGPVTVTGWTHDLVLEDSAGTSQTTGSVDPWDAYAFYAASAKEEGALCAKDGSLTSASGNDYLITPLAGKNGLRISASETGELTFDTPVTGCDKIYALATYNYKASWESDANAGSNVTWTVTYSDGTTEAIKTKVKFYETTADNLAKTVDLIKIDRSGYTGKSYSVYEYEITLDPAKTAEKLTIKHTNWSGNLIVIGFSTGKGSGSDVPDTPSQAIACAGYDIDVIVEGIDNFKNLATAPASPVGIEGVDKQLVFYTDDVLADGAICGADGKVALANGHEYSLNPVANNALKLDAFAEHTLTLSTPVSGLDKVYLLAFGNHSYSVKYTVACVAAYDDGTSNTNGEWFQVGRWGNTEDSGVALENVGCLDWNTGDPDGAPKYRIYECAIPVDPSKNLVSLAFTNYAAAGNGDVVLLGLSTGTATSGIDSVFGNDDAEKTVTGIYNLRGMKVNADQKGIVIVRYSDGTARKVLNK